VYIYHYVRIQRGGRSRLSFAVWRAEGARRLGNVLVRIAREQAKFGGRAQVPSFQIRHPVPRNSIFLSEPHTCIRLHSEATARCGVHGWNLEQEFTGDEGKRCWRLLEGPTGNL